MNIIYQCYGSAHSSVTAAAIHLGKLPENRIPTVKEVMNLPDFDRSLDTYIGTLFYKGKDECGISVYTLGLGREWQVGLRSVESLLQLIGQDPSTFRIVHALNCITFTTKLGGALSRKYGFWWMGRRLAAYGVRKSYPRLVTLVQEVKNDLHRT
ncbi:DUF3189 family protein [Melghirimyces algeriensis]|uniref:DUF3189 domain-containing protein n=1 Tax=Melghirimyces algeriensis TaxID=910412 RepID=A0A521B530_9BACL|nr:DUF3189 family protein [Melghirimyces algeriensis]SMO42151.1 Protein of unknown function [Melghirimyces algeriensis]